MSDIHLDIEIRGAKSLHQYDELVKIFLQPAEYSLHGPEDGMRTPALSYDVSSDEETGKMATGTKPHAGSTRIWLRSRVNVPSGEY